MKQNMSELIEKLEYWRILPVASVTTIDQAARLADALDEAGLSGAEITLRTDAAYDAIQVLKDRQGFLVGAGTVHNVEQAARVAEAGARFVVSPGFNPRTVAWCLENELPIIPGISSPTDLEQALEFGLKTVKFFPAEASGGTPMLRALAGPYAGIRFIPTGGIHQNNLKDYLGLKNVLACGGSWFVATSLLANNRYSEVTQLTMDALRAAESKCLVEPNDR